MKICVIVSFYTLHRCREREIIRALVHSPVYTVNIVYKLFTNCSYVVSTKQHSQPQSVSLGNRSWRTHAALAGMSRRCREVRGVVKCAVSPPGGGRRKSLPDIPFAYSTRSCGVWWCHVCWRCHYDYVAVI